MKRMGTSKSTGLQLGNYRRRIGVIASSVVILVAGILLVGSEALSSKTAHADSINTTDFVITVKTDNPGSSNSSSFTIPTHSTVYGYDYSVDWNDDGTFDQTGLTGNVTHDFGVPGTYTIRIKGTFPQIFFSGGGDAQKLIDIDQWGNIQWKDFYSAFEGASNLQISAVDTPDLSAVTSMESMFYGATSFNSNIDNWNTSNITDMSYMFDGATSFNQDISHWDTSNVTTMAGMFTGASAFNRPLNSWNTSNVIDTSDMFSGASSFNQPLGNWDMSNVAIMANMFANATSFNQDISQWNVSKVTYMAWMFADDTAFNQDISHWNTSSVTNMSFMFGSAASFNKSLAGLDMTHVTDASGMLSYSGLSASNYDATLAGWSQQVLQTNVPLGATNLIYCSSTAARQSIINTYQWTITGDSVCPSPSNLRLFSSYTTTYDLVASGTDLGTLSVDNNTGNLGITYAISCNTPGSNDGSFAIQGSELFAATDLHYDTINNANKNYNVCVKATNQYGQSIEQTFTFAVYPPTLGGVSPSQLTVDGGSHDVQLYGNGLQPGSRVYFGGSELPVTYVSSDELTVSVSTAGVTATKTVDVTLQSPDGNTQTRTNAFTYYVQPPNGITDVAFDNLSHPTTLTVNGNGLLHGDPTEINNILIESMVTLNGTPLAFCSSGLGMSAAEIATYYNISPDLVTDDAPCYEVIANGGIIFTDNQVMISLPASFSATAKGTVSVNGSPTYTFNGDGGITTPTAFVDGSKPIDKMPTISDKPTFSGMATPGARIIVTVHSNVVTCATTADNSGNWSCTLPSSLPAGVHTVFVQVTNPDGSVQTLGPYSVIVNGGSTLLAPNSGLPEQGSISIMTAIQIVVAFFASLVGVVIAIRKVDTLVVFRH